MFKRKRGSMVPEQTGLFLIALLFLLVVLMIIFFAKGQGDKLLNNFKGLITGFG